MVDRRPRDAPAAGGAGGAGSPSPNSKGAKQEKKQVANTYENDYMQYIRELPDMQRTKWQPFDSGNIFRRGMRNLKRFESYRTDMDVCPKYGGGQCCDSTRAHITKIIVDNFKLKESQRNMLVESLKYAVSPQRRLAAPLGGRQ